MFVLEQNTRGSWRTLHEARRRGDLHRHASALALLRPDPEVFLRSLRIKTVSKNGVTAMTNNVGLSTLLAKKRREKKALLQVPQPLDESIPEWEEPTPAPRRFPAKSR